MNETNEQRSYKIEKNIPIPPKESNKKFYRVYPYDEMEIGDSFFVPGNFRGGSGLSGSMLKYAKANNKKFTSRKLNENGKPGIRIWRIK